MTEEDVTKKIKETFPYLENKRFSCAVEKVDNHSSMKYEFCRTPRVWNGETMKRKARGAAPLWILEEKDPQQSSDESNYYESDSTDTSAADTVPAEILARGPLYVQAYNKAIEEGVTRVVREPIMIIGQARSGKTSLKKSLKRQSFDENEESTDGIEQDPSYFSVTSEILTTGETVQEPDSDAEVSFHNRVAKCMMDELRWETDRIGKNSLESESLQPASIGNSEESKVSFPKHIIDKLDEIIAYLQSSHHIDEHI